MKIFEPEPRIDPPDHPYQCQECHYKSYNEEDFDLDLLDNNGIQLCLSCADDYMDEHSFECDKCGKLVWVYDLSEAAELDWCCDDCYEE